MDGGVIRSAGLWVWQAQTTRLPLFDAVRLSANLSLERPMNRYALRATLVKPARSVLAPAKVTYEAERHTWILEESYTYSTAEFRLTIGAGFEFDLSSLPRVIWPVIAPFELSIVAPLVHDFIYRYRGKAPREAVTPFREFTRAETDLLFKQIMDAEHVEAWRSTAAYRAVRMFGWMYWR